MNRSEQGPVMLRHRVAANWAKFPPPCGEGLGVGVQNLRSSDNDEDPPPQPSPHKGGGVG